MGHIFSRFSPGRRIASCILVVLCVLSMLSAKADAIVLCINSQGSTAIEVFEGHHAGCDESTNLLSESAPVRQTTLQSNRCCTDMPLIGICNEVPVVHQPANVDAAMACGSRPVPWFALLPARLSGTIFRVPGPPPAFEPLKTIIMVV